jgi:hypothetical protein
MTKSVKLFAAAVFAFGLPGTSSAAPLNYEGTLVLEFATLAPIPAIGTGVATVNDSGGLGHLGNLRLRASRGGISTPSAMVPVTDTLVPFLGVPIVTVWVDAGIGSGILGPISAGAQSSALTKNRLPVAGLAKFCVFSTACGTFLPLQLTQHTGGTGTKGVGIGGIITIGFTSPIRISIEAAPWTIKTGTSIDQITTPVGGTAKKYVILTAMGFAHAPNSNTSSTANPSGVVQLITPMQVVTNLQDFTNLKVALFGYLTIRFIPEPGMLMLLGAGVAGLVLLGRNRMRD